jgi:predicted nucleotidyltransferase
MVKKKVRTVIEFFADRLLEQKLNISKIILFGSHAAGTADMESDIDIVIVSEDFKKKNIFKRVDLIKNAEIQTIKIFLVPLDVVVMTPEEYENRTSIIAEYAHSGEVLFAA